MPKYCDVEPDDPAKVLPPPVHQRREVHRVPSGTAVVVRARVDRRAVVAHLAVGVEGERDERGRAVLARELPADRALVDLAPRQVRRILPPTSRADRRRFGRPFDGGKVPADSLPTQVSVSFSDRFAQIIDLVNSTFSRSLAVLSRQVRAVGDERDLIGRRRLAFGDGFVVEVPSLAALGHAGAAVAVRAGRALARLCGVAAHRDDPDLPGVQVDDLTHHRPGAHAVLLSRRLDHVKAERQPSTFGRRHARNIKGHSRNDAGCVCRGVRFGHHAASLPAPSVRPVSSWTEASPAVRNTRELDQIRVSDVEGTSPSPVPCVRPA